MTEPGKKEIKGKLRAGWNSYYNPDEHGTMTQTVAGTSDDDKHSEETITWPEEVDPENLTDKQQRAFELALQNPKRSCESIDEEINSVKYSSQVFRTKAPNWYENVFKELGDSTRDKAKGKPKLTVKRVEDYIRNNQPVSASEIQDALGYTYGPISDRITQSDKITYETGVAGYPNRAKVYSLSSPQADSEASESDIEDGVDEIETPMPSIAEIEEVKTVCEYLSRKDTPEGELATWVLEVLE